MEQFDAAFLERYAEIERQRGRTIRHADPAGDLDAWASFTEECVDGYDGTLSDYDYDMILRDFIELLLQDALLRGTPSFMAYETAVKASDERLREVSTVNLPRASKDLPWWHRTIPYYGYEWFVDDVKARLGIQLELKGDASPDRPEAAR